MLRGVFEKLILLFWRPATWIVLGVTAIVVLIIVFARHDSRIPAKAGFPDDSVMPIFKDEGKPDTAYCPRNDYTLKWIVWGGEFVPRCFPKGSE